MYNIYLSVDLSIADNLQEYRHITNHPLGSTVPESSWCSRAMGTAESILAPEIGWASPESTMGPNSWLREWALQGEQPVVNPM